ncbi:MAG TPA: pyrroloquinoline quinone biosynthesis protein PqqB [Polyangiaceae bacterium]|jgi:pyrroloquinoline quinone biosynthesis protein B
MQVRILGSAAGGGFPQWNCGCPNCCLVRAGDPRVRARTQDAIAVSVDGEVWHVVNASPDVRVQIEANPPLQPRSQRHTPIGSILLTNGDMDHVLGLFSLRESTPLEVWATDAVKAGLEERNALMRTLHRFPEQLTWKRLELGRAAPLGDPSLGLTVEARPIAGKAPVHLTGLAAPSAEDNVALWIRHGGKTVVYAAACAAVSGESRAEAFDDADLLLFDGTFWSSDELVRGGLSRARAEDMAHLPIGGEGGSLERLRGTRARRKVFTHLNNSNPVLVEGSTEHAAVVAAGWEVAFDGMEIAV